MPHSASPLRRFVGRVHRRLVALRVVEAGGLGLLAGSGFAVLMGGLLIGIGRPAAPAVIVALTAGAACGAAAGFARRPGLMQAAVRADRQLGLDDLLSTALVVARSEDSWARVVLQSADARCATLSPSAVLVRRLDGRAWGGIGVTVGLALTVAAYSSASAGGGAAGRPEAAAAGRPSVVANLPPIAAPDAPLRAGDTTRRRRTWSDPEEADRSFGADSTVADRFAGDPGAADPANENRPGPGGADATGGGSSGNDAPRPKRDGRPPIAGGAPRATPAGAGVTAAGAARGSIAPSGRTDEAAGGASGGTAAGPTPAAPPWRGADWPRDVDAARAAVDAGRVPDAYRDVVRDYFERP